MTERPRPVTALRDTVPPHVDAAIMKSLEKLPADRLPSAAAFAAALADPAAAPAPVASRTVPPRARPARAAPLAAVALLGAALGWAAARAAAPGPAPERERPRVRFAIEPDSGVVAYTTPPALSRTATPSCTRPTGGTAPGCTSALRRDRVAPPRRHRGRRVAVLLPDGRWVAFYSKGALRRVRVDGGASALVTEMPRRRCSSAARGARTARSSTRPPGRRSTASRRTAATRRGSPSPTRGCGWCTRT
jgi:serine/threonine-protein kinase